MKTKFRLFKRNDQCKDMDAAEPGFKERPYYFKFTFKGKKYPRCLETNDATEAQRRAKLKYQEITTAIIRGEYDKLDGTKTRHEATATLAELLAAYKTSPSDANAATRKHNARALCRILGYQGLATDDGWLTVAGPVTDLTAAVARAFFTTANAAALAEKNQVQAASIRRTANSTWRQGRSLFTPKCLEHYRREDIYNLCMDDFTRAGDAARFTGRSVPKIAYNPPTDDVINTTLAAWAELADTDRNLYLAIGHELAFGLRAGEVAQARWNWHQVRSGYPVLDGCADVKAGTGHIQVRALDPYYTQMQIKIDLHGWRANAEPDDYIIPGCPTYRTDGLFRACTEWLRRHGWQTQKTNHALRALAGGQIAMKYGIYEAQMFLRHSTVKVTEQNYSHFIKKFRPADLNTIEARWATVETKVASGKLDATLDAISNVQQGPSAPTPVTAWTAASRN